MEMARSRHNDIMLHPATTLDPLGSKTNRAHSGTNLIGDEANFILQLIFFVLLSGAFGLFGTATNIINIIIFTRQGLFTGGSTLNLFFLSIADLGVVFTNVLQSIGFAVIVADIPNLSWDPFSVVYLVVGWPHTIFIIINRMLTAYVAFERCMCVVLPFEVQRLFTPHRSLVHLLTIFSYSFLSHEPIYLTHSLGFEDQEGTNQTKLVLIFGPNRDVWYETVYYANFFAISFLSVFIVLVCTVITSAHVTNSKEWRKSMTAGTKGVVSTIQGPNKGPNASDSPVDGTKKKRNVDNTSKDKEKKLVKMITAISIIFLICYLPELAMTVTRAVDERVRSYGQYDRLAHIIYSLTFVVATANSSLNIFVYYNMSSRYKKYFFAFFSSSKGAHE